MENLDKNAMIKAVIEEEWRQFDLVQNEGGRASCQDNWPTFRLRRYAQFAPWPVELLVSYFSDLREYGYASLAEAEEKLGGVTVL